MNGSAVFHFGKQPFHFDRVFIPVNMGDRG